MTLGAGIDVVSWYAFRGCYNLKRIDFAGGQPDIWSETFNDVPDNAIVGYKGRDVSVKALKDRLMECMIEYEGPGILSDELIDEALAKQAAKEKKPEKKKHAYRGR